MPKGKNGRPIAMQDMITMLWSKSSARKLAKYVECDECGLDIYLIFKPEAINS